MARRWLVTLVVLVWTPSALSQIQSDDWSLYPESQNDWVWDLISGVSLPVAFILIILVAMVFMRRAQRRYSSIADTAIELQTQAMVKMDESIALQREAIGIAKSGVVSSEKLIELCEQSLLEQRKANELLQRLVDANRRAPG